MTNILTNSAALKSLYHLQRNEGRATEATERLASGKRLNKAGDDAAGAAAGSAGGNYFLALAYDGLLGENAAGEPWVKPNPMI